MAKNPNNNRIVAGLRVEVGENFNSALRKFKKKVDDSGLLEDVKKRMQFEKPTTERKRKKGAAKARLRKQIRSGIE